MTGTKKRRQPDTLIIRRWGLVPYGVTLDAMHAFTESRDEKTLDELWVVEHPPVYTRGLNAKHQPDSNASSTIPVRDVDRGGDITYHGPGQLVVYLLVDLQRQGWGLRQLVNAMEQSVVKLLAGQGIQGAPRKEAPGIYIEGRKIASLGLRVRRGCSYHGLALNIDMDLTPFKAIPPCGYQDLAMTQITEWLDSYDFAGLSNELLGHLATELCYRTQHLRYLDQTHQNYVQHG
ncbi:MAG: lipoyl(octanoyl) transferase LipB [Gammaproteobacteria bacterium]|nr:MAG: lipoyl(octanoyl) transferase LipB [Gammaproteobacteria bacterium]